MKTTILILLVILSISCEKENIINKPILSGSTNDNMIYEKFTPEISINYVWDSCGYGDGKDSIDILNDGIYDIRLTARFLDYDVFMDCCSEDPDCWPSGLRYHFSSINKVEIATYQEPYDDDTYFTFADTLNEGYRIDTIKHWQNQDDLWCNDYPSPHQGSWYFIKNDKYLAFRMGDSTNYKYGWIKIGTNSDHNLVFKEYSIEK